jgi:hypothetical protein
MNAEELNRAIAERVMGWHVGKYDALVAEDGLPEDGHWFMLQEPSETFEYEGARRWNPCQNWAHFGIVLGRIALDENTNWLQLELSEVGTSIWIAPKYKGLSRHGFSSCESRDDFLRAACAVILEAWGDD